MALEFSSKDDKIISQSLGLGTISQTPHEDLDTNYEIPRCVRWIQDHQFQNVCLQFPDCLLKDSVAVSQKIRNQTKAKIYILADTTYGSCCVDEIAAEHVKGDAIIHFGHSCLSPVQKLPVLFVFGKETIDCHHAVEEFQKLLPRPEAKIILIYEVTYYHALDGLKNELLSVYPNVVVSELKIPETTINRKCESEIVSEKEGHENFSCCQNQYSGCCNQSERKFNESETESNVISSEFPVFKCENEETNQFCKLGRVFPVEECNIADYCVFFIGSEGCCLSTFLMTFNKCTFYTYNPTTRIARLETLNINRALMRRYYLIEQAKDANVVGIVVGTLGVSNFRNIIDQLRSTLLEAGKKVYVLAMGKPNVAKLANFPEIDIFVLVACPENSLLDSKEFFRPVITPFEMDIACNQARTWSGDYITDFAELLPGASAYVPVADNIDNEETNVSLITGKLRTAGISKNIEGSDNNALIKRSDILTVAPLHEGGAGEFLSQRSWKGLEQHLGDTPTAVLQDGQHGIAAGYSHEYTSN